MFVSVPLPCSELPASHAPCVYIVTVGSPPAVSATCARSEQLHQPWHRQTFDSADVAAAVCKGAAAGCSWAIESAVRDFHRETDVYLATTPHGPLTLLAERHNNGYSTSSPQVRVGFAFCVPDECRRSPVSRAVLHANGHEILAYGRQVWLSIDGGQVFHRLATLPGNDIATTMTTTTFQSGFALVTAQQRVYYGRTGVAQLASVVSPLPQFSTPVLYWTSEGSLVACDVSTGDTGLSLHSSVRLPVEASAAKDDWSFGCDLVPSWFTGAVDISCGDTPSCNSTCFDAMHVGRLISAAGGSIHIHAVVNGTASGVVAEPLQAEIGDISQRSLRLSPVQLAGNRTGRGSCGFWVAALLARDDLVAHSDTPRRWRFYDRGKTLMTHGSSRADRHSYFVKDVINATHVLLARYSVCERGDVRGNQTLDVERWHLYDLSEHEEGRTSQDSDLRLDALADDGRFAVYLANESRADAPDDRIVLGTSTHVSFIAADGAEHIGAIDTDFATESAGVESVHVRVLPSTSVALGSGATVNEWSAFSVEAMDLAAGIVRKRRSWKLLVPPCSGGRSSTREVLQPPLELFEAGGTYLGSMVRFVDLHERTDLRTRATDLVHEPSIRLTSVQPRTVHASFGADYVASISVTEAAATDGTSAVQFAPAPMFPLAHGGVSASLRCAVGAQSLIVVTGCRPNTQLVHAETTGRQLLADTPLAPAPGRWTELRPNYRPPSALGRAVPTADSIYNADPSLPRDVTYERYAVSRDSGRYNKCIGQTDRAACACPAASVTAAAPNQVDMTDCITSVFTVHFSVPFVPNFVVVADSADVPPQATPLALRYTLEEINGRTDFCLNTSGPGGCGSVNNAAEASASRLLVMDAGARDAILWQGGGELYHFRAKVTAATAASLCEMQTEFVVSATAICHSRLLLPSLLCGTGRFTWTPFRCSRRCSTS